MAKLSGQDLFLEIQEKVVLMDKALAMLGKRGRTFAECEREYRVSLAKQMLIEREKGMPATILQDICRGDREIARLRFERDVAEVTYKAAMEAINIYKKQVDLLREQLDREWHRN